MKEQSKILSRFAGVALATVLSAAPALASTITSCVGVSCTPAVATPGGTASGTPFLVSNNGGQTVTYFEEPAITVPPANTSTGTIELGYLSTAINTSAASTPAPASFGLYLFNGATALPVITGSISSTGVLTFSGTSSGGWVTSTVNGSVVEYDAALGLEVAVPQTTAFNSSSILGGKQTVLDGVVTSTPEPATYSYILVGGLALVAAGRRRAAR